MATLPLDPHAVDRVVRARWDADVLPALCEYVTVPCLSPAFDRDWMANGHIARAARLLADWCRQRTLDGVTVDIVEASGRTPVLLVEVAPSAHDGAPTVLVYGHLDKQPPLGSWRSGLDPYHPVLDGDRLYGRGTADDGYAVFAAMTALEALACAGAARPRVLVLIEASEESGSPDLPDHLGALEPRLGRPDLVVCLDSGAPTYDRLWLTSSLRGAVVATVTVEVLTEGLHSGGVGGIVPSSFRLMRQLLSRVEDERTGELLIPELRAVVPPAQDRELRTVADVLGVALEPGLPTVPGLELAGAGPGDRLVLRAWGSALEVTGLRGAPDPADAGNVLRPSTTAKMSIRLPPSCDADAAAAALVSALTTHPPSGARVRVELETSADGWVAGELGPELEALLASASVAHFGAPSAAAGEGGSIPFLAMLGKRFPRATMLATGVLGPGSNAHGPNEALHLPTARALSACLAQVTAGVAARSEPAAEGGASR